jgi:(E)-4-hydroxy-3-methylbut-2-enyl-diphosphate synthase
MGSSPSHIRRKSREVYVGHLAMGAQQPIRIQSMCNTPLHDTKATWDQILALHEAGCEYVRLSVPTLNDLVLLEKIKSRIENAQIPVPLIADVHFNPLIAEKAAYIVEKIRINPGNYADKKSGKKYFFSENEYQDELKRIKERFLPLVEICKKENKAMRIGTNHGSLSDRIISRYGNTAFGMVESALEFLRICRDLDFHSIVLSMKSSNPLIMIEAYRLLVQRMQEEKMDYPLHIGITEAGKGLQGRVKSSVGIGTLLEEGLGDTIRVSLTESPLSEIPVARKLTEKYSCIRQWNSLSKPETITPRRSIACIGIGGQNNLPVFLASGHGEKIRADLLIDHKKRRIRDCRKDFQGKEYPLFFADNVEVEKLHKEEIYFIIVDEKNINPDLMRKLQSLDKILILLKIHSMDSSELRKSYEFLNRESRHPLIFYTSSGEKDMERWLIRQSLLIGALLIQGCGDGICLENTIHKKLEAELGSQILQACRRRISQMEYIICPGCGRTTYDIEKRAGEVQEKFKDYTGLKIAIMGCIVNGIGEMGDADYGYVGTAKGKVSLYRNKEAIRKNIDNEEALDALFELIKADGRLQKVMMG